VLPFYRLFQHPAEGLALGVDNEPLGRFSDVEKRIARHERQRSVRRSMEHMTVTRHNDFGPGHFVVIRAGRRRDHDIVAGTDVLQRTENGVTMGGDPGIPMMPGKSRVRDMPGAEIKRVPFRSLHEGHRQTESRNLQHAQEIAMMHQLPGGMQRSPRRVPEHGSIGVLELLSAKRNACAHQQNSGCNRND
jgi:hypothetical protein